MLTNFAAMNNYLATFFKPWSDCYDRCRLEITKLVTAEPDGHHAGSVHDYDELPDAELCFDFAALDAAVDELADLTDSILKAVPNPYKDEERCVAEAADTLRKMTGDANGLRGVMEALQGARSAVEYVLRDDRVDVADYYENGPFDHCPDPANLPDGCRIEQCAYCSRDFPTNRAGEDASPWCSDDCFEAHTSD